MDREELLLTTKIWGGRGYSDTEKSIDESLCLLQTDYIGLFLIHEPSGHFEEIYKAMENAYNAGKLRVIGVTNFLEDNYLRLIANCSKIPAIYQLETHVFHHQQKNAISAEGARDTLNTMVAACLRRELHFS